MAKKILFIMLMVMIGLSVNAYAAGIDQLDDRAGTENLAGITWDQIQEQAQNSPNSLTPIQGLVLWMFAILAFLKLAQKMDSLLQSLGLNVTQTGGRALGDLVMAGMALKHVGGAISKGMGMFGFGRGGGGSPGGASGTGSGTGSGSAGGRGPTPIPTGGPGGGAMPSGATPPGGTASGAAAPTGSSPSGAAPSGSSPSGATPSGATPAGGSPTGTATGGGTPPSGRTPTGSPSGSTETEATGGRNPVGKAVDWMRQDGFAQGAIKAGAKGGVIGLGIYTAKTGASKIGAAVSAGLGDRGISSNPENNIAGDSAFLQNEQQLDNQNRTGTASAFNSENPEEFHDSRPLDGTEEQTPIPTSINGEEYQETSAFGGSDGSDDSGVIPSSYNAEDFNDAGSFNAEADTIPIPTSAGSANGQDSDSELDGSSSDSAVTTSDGETWHDSKPTALTKDTPPIPASVNNEAWNETNPSGSKSDSVVLTTAAASAVSHDTKAVDAVKDTPPATKAINDGAWNETAPSGSQPATPVPVAAAALEGAAPLTNPANAPIGTSQQSNGDGIVKPTVSAQQENAVSTSGVDTQIKQVESTPAQTTASGSQQESATSVSSVESVTRQDVSTASVSSSVSSESVSAVTESSSATHESSSHESSTDNNGTQSEADASSSSGEVYESRPMPLNNQTIAADLPQTTPPPISTQDAATIDSSGASPIASPTDSGEISSNGHVSQPETVQTAQTQAITESIRMDSPPGAQVQPASAAVQSSEQSPMTQQNTTDKSQTINVTNVTEGSAVKPGQTAAQPGARVVQVEKQGYGANTPAKPNPNTGSNRPTAQGKPKTPAVKGRKRKR